MIKKKNVLMRSAGLLLALVLVTSCFVGSTLAKYVTSGDAADNARVAKWGVSITAHATGDIFAKEYKGAGQDNTVVAGGEYKVIAPGTKKDDAALVTLSGKPEVSVQVTYNAEHFSLTGKWVGDKNDTFYCPLIIKVTGKVGDAVKTETINCVEKGSAADVEKAVKDAVAAVSATYGPNTDLSTVAGDGLKISWEWPFEGTAN